MCETKIQVLCIFFLFGAVCAYRNSHGYVPEAYSPLVTEYEWKYLDYLWESPGQKEYFIRSGRYDPKNMVPIDVDRAKDGRTFVTVIRTAGVPASLHTVSDKKGESGPLLKPYPDWSWYENPERCQGITSVYRVAIDNCNTLWVLDTGKIDENFVCPAKLLAFDLYTDRLLYWKVIPDYVARNRRGEGLLVTPIVETYDRFCINKTVYIADVVGKGLVVWNGYRFFRLEADVYEPEERNANFDIAGERFHLADGVLGMALSPVRYPGDNRYLTFRPLASRSLFAANTKVLASSSFGSIINYYRGWDMLPSQASAMAFSSEGTLFHGLTHEIAIGCWNMNRPLSPEYFRIAVQDKKRLQFASGMKVVTNALNLYGEQLLVMTNRLQKIYAGTQNFREINFRVLRASVKDLIRGTLCDVY